MERLFPKVNLSTLNDDDNDALPVDDYAPPVEAKAFMAFLFKMFYGLCWAIQPPFCIW